MSLNKLLSCRGHYLRAPECLQGFAWLAEFCVRFLAGKTITLNRRRVWAPLVFKIEMLDLNIIKAEWSLTSRVMAVARERMAAAIDAAILNSYEKEMV